MGFGLWAEFSLYTPRSTLLIHRIFLAGMDDSSLFFCYLARVKTLLIIAGIAAGGWVLLMLGLKGMAALLRKSAVRATKAALHGMDILMMTDNASFLGADFPGPNLPPGTSGVLAITGDRLFFLPWFPRRAITLPGDSVAGVSLKDHFGKKAYNIPALQVKVKGVGDPHGKMAWLTHDGDAWEREIRKLIGER